MRTRTSNHTDNEYIIIGAHTYLRILVQNVAIILRASSIKHQGCTHNACTTVGAHSVAERINIVLQRLQRHALFTELHTWVYVCMCVCACMDVSFTWEKLERLQKHCYDAADAGACICVCMCSCMQAIDVIFERL